MAQRRKGRLGWIAGAVALILLVAAVGVGWFLGSGGREGEAPTASEGASAASGGGSGSSEDSTSRCGLPEGDQAVPAEGPEAEWQILMSHTVPSSEKFGPGETKGGDRACFAHNPTGALFALLNTGRVLPTEHKIKHVTDGPLRDSLVGAEEETPDPNSRTTVRGFKLDVVSKDEVVVRPVYSTDGGELYEVGMRMVWSEGDWKIDGTQDAASTPDPVDSLEGYVTWGPE